MEESWKFEMRLQVMKNPLLCLGFCGIGEETLSSNMCQKIVLDWSKVNPFIPTIRHVADMLTLQSTRDSTFQRGYRTILPSRHCFPYHHSQGASRYYTFCGMLTTHSIWIHIFLDKLSA